MFEFGETGENLMINGEMSSTPAAKVKSHPKRSMKLSKVKVHNLKLNCNYFMSAENIEEPNTLIIYCIKLHDNNGFITNNKISFYVLLNVCLGPDIVWLLQIILLNQRCAQTSNFPDDRSWLPRNK